MPDDYNWWDVPADYYGPELGDYTSPNFSLLDPTMGGTNLDIGTPGQWFYDTMTGQIVDQAFVTANSGGGTATYEDFLQRSPTATQDASPGGFGVREAIGALMAVGGLTTAGMAVASLFTGGDAENRTSTQTTTTGPAGGPGAINPLANQLLTGNAPGGAGGAGAAVGAGGGAGMVYDTQTGQYLTPQAAQALDSGAFQAYNTAFGGAGGLLGMAGAAAESVGGPGGLMNQQQQILGALPANIPALNPAITNAIQSNALGMSQGMLPALADPNIQQRIAQVYQPGFDALNYTAGQALDQAQQQLQQRGFEAPDIREGPTQALTAPILAAQQLGRSQLFGQMAGSQLDLASRLPMQGSQLAAQDYALRSQPFGLGVQAVGAFNQPIATQGQMPLSLFDILQRGQGTTSTVNTVGPQPSLTTQLGQVTPAIGAAGSLLGSAGNMLYPPQNQSGFLFNPYTGGSLYGGG